MYSLRPFIVVFQELHFYYNVYHYFVVCSMYIPSFVFIGCCVSELKAHLCLYRNVWPEVIFYKNYIVYQIVYMLI